MKKIAALISIILAFSFRINAQCDISPVSAKLCKGNSITFSIAALPGSYNSIKWIFGDGDSSVQKTSIISHIYVTSGTFNVSVTLYDAGMNIICGPKLSFVQVFDLPTAQFDLLTDSNQHFSNNLFKFAEKAIPGNSNALIIFRKWYFGDGDSSLLANPTHIYSGCATYPIKLIVEDSNGCLDTIYKPNYIISNGPQPKFIVLDSTGCAPPFTMFVKDMSRFVTKWEYYKGDGTKSVYFVRPIDSIFGPVYLKAGTYYPYLIGYDSAFNSGLGKWISCSASYADPADANQPHFKIVVLTIYLTNFTGPSLVQSGDTAIFIDLCDSAYDSLFWSWGDGDHFEIRGRGNATHVYNLPAGIDDKTYTVALDAYGYGIFCPDRTKYWKIRVVRTLGINQVKVNDQILVFPNPFSVQTKVILPKNSKHVSEVSLFDMNGKRMQAETNISGNSILLYRNQLLPGIYTLKIIAERVYLVKVIIQ